MLQINMDTFETEVIKANKPVIVDFWGPSCQPCLSLMPEVERLSELYQDQVKIVKVNSKENRRLCINLRVLSLPTFLAFKEGEVVKSISGSEITVEDIESLIKEIA